MVDEWMNKCARSILKQTCMYIRCLYARIGEIAWTENQCLDLAKHGCQINIYRNSQARMSTKIIVQNQL